MNKTMEPVCDICKKAVEIQHTPARDPIKGGIGHDYCLRIETIAERTCRAKAAYREGLMPTFPLRWA